MIANFCVLKARQVHLIEVVWFNKESNREESFIQLNREGGPQAFYTTDDAINWAKRFYSPETIYRIVSFTESWLSLPRFSVE